MSKLSSVVTSVLVNAASGKVTYTGLAIVAVGQVLELAGIVPVGSSQAVAGTLVGLAVAVWGRFRREKRA